MFLLIYIHQCTHSHIYILCDISMLLSLYIKKLGELVLRSILKTRDFVALTFIVFVFLKFLKTYSNGIFTLTEMYPSTSCHWKSHKLKITEWNSLMWHRYMSKLYHTLFLHNKCIVYIVFFRSGVSSTWVAKTLTIGVNTK